MPKSENQKKKLIYVLRILMENSDEAHPVSMKSLISSLEKYDIHAERKSIYTDIEALRELGYDIEMIPGKNGGYYVASRNFELAELKLLVDAVCASKFVTEKKSRELIKKITALSGKYEAGQLKREVYVVDRVKSENESILYNIDEIYQGIREHRKITFQYLEYTLQKEEHFRRNGQLYQVEPIAMTWNDENYYLIGFDVISEGIRHYRVDKMKNISMTEEKSLPRELLRNFDLAKYCNKTFGMYAGEEAMVTILFPNHLIGVVIDRFGKDITPHKHDENSFTVRRSIQISPQFFGWLTSLGKDVKILLPKEVAADYKVYLSEIMKQYQEED